MKLNKTWAIVLGIILLLVIARITLPYFVTRYVNKTLSELEGYDGSIEGVSIAIIRGAYSIHGLVIDKEESNLKVPFVEIKEIDLSVEWPALFKGNIAGEILVTEPKINFVAGPEEEEEMDGSEADWDEVIKDLMPIQINRFEVREGNVHYYSFSTNPQVDLYFRNLNLVAENLSNVEDNSERLPSSLSVRAISIGEGNLQIDARLNVLKTIPEFDMNVKFTDVQLPSFNELTEAYGNFTFKQGNLHLVSEAKLLDGSIDGYVKPLLRDVEIIKLSEDVGKKSFPRIIWESILEIGKSVFENPKKDQVATVVPIKGRLEDVETQPWTAVKNVFKNAFVEAFTAEFERFEVATEGN